MSETRDQFRERIGSRHFDTFHIAQENGRNHDEAWLDAAEAVYTQALRDVLSMKQSGDWDDAEIVYVHDIESYAGYHGIDLEEES